MASQLEESTKTAKKIALGCGVMIAIIVIISIVSQLIKGEPPPCNPYPAVAENKFGQLPRLELEGNELSQDESPRYEVDLDKLPQMVSFVNVYKTKTPRQSLTAQDDAIQVATNLGFRENMQKLSTSELKWKRDTSTLKINELYNTVQITTNYKNTQWIANDNYILVDQNPYIASARNLFRKTYAGAKMDTAEAVATYLKMDSNFNFIKAFSASEADFVRVDFFKQLEGVTPFVPAGCTSDQRKYVQENLDSLRISYYLHTIEPQKSYNYAVLKGTSGTNDILELSYIDWEIESSSVYSTLTVGEAWEELEKGNGYLRSLYRTSVGDPFQNDFTIPIEAYLLNDVEMIYYTIDDYTQYIQPVFKFSGIAQIQGTTDKYAEFIFYYPAIRY
ncbi:MAG: hypothetical protein PHS44_07880 [Candidatus Dojkabacteria bacterium]|nr:hypothetical protein [Candidatus Dojkabacteria bacterium]